MSGGASMKDIKLRIKSVESTMQITKAMELVASSKLNKAKLRVERSRPYFTLLHQTLAEIAEANTEFSSAYVQRREVKKRCVVLIAGDRGLAGGYNSNLFKLAAEKMQGAPCCALPVGKKAVEFCRLHGVEAITGAFSLAEDVSVSDCFAMSRLLCEGFLAGEFDELIVCYTNFVSMLSQSPAALGMLPLSPKMRRRGSAAPRQLVLYEPGSEAVYDAIVPGYLAGMLWGALCESFASEVAARRMAMDAASKNAAEMIEDLNLRYNRARQGAITQEITEIVAGAEE